MPATLDLDADELADIKAFTNQTDDVSALRIAKAEFLRFIRRMQLKKLSGKVQMEENWKQLEEAELREQHGNSGLGTA